jgi:DNA-binding response OmpR family regulator
VLPLCLIVARDPVFASTLHREMERFGFKPYSVETIAAASNLIRQWRFDAVVLDGDGFLATLPTALPMLRAGVPAPILLLTSCADEERQIDALDSGATEIVLKPTSERLIAAKLRRLLDVSGEPRFAPAEEVQLGPLRMNPARVRASIGETELSLTAGEFELLLLLASRPGQFVHRDHIARTLRSPGAHVAAGATRRSADMHVCRIRKKLRDAGARDLHLETVYGRGYLLRLGADEDDCAVADRDVEWAA